ncbi:MAG: prepilin-type N-terminal cleavage/methylation domain-containing protein [Chthonomonadaceae bacterium]|nr:prepilin-type N-terminal cleavage/methylation domain-containing protein [Chthonomonadaceae bacterium]
MKRRAFTLIELLVVIAIIAILAAILFPVFAQAKESAKKTADVMQFKQMGSAIQIYITDTDDVLPNAFPRNMNTRLFVTPVKRLEYLSEELKSLHGSNWANAIIPYIKNLDIYKSPCATVPWYPNQGNPDGSYKEFTLSYFMNSYLNLWPSTNLEEPSAVPLVWLGTGKAHTPGWSFSYPLIRLAGNRWLNSDNVVREPYLFQRDGPNCPNAYGVFGGLYEMSDMRMFRGGMNLVRADGHVKWVRNGAPNSPNAGVRESDGRLMTYWVDRHDCFDLGCCYSLAHSPYRTTQ